MSDVTLKDNTVVVDGTLHADQLFTWVVGGNFLGRRAVGLELDEVHMLPVQGLPIPPNTAPHIALANSNEYLVLNQEKGFTNGVLVDGSLRVEGQLMVQYPGATAAFTDLIQLVHRLETRIEQLEAAALPQLPTGGSGWKPPHL